MFLCALASLRENPPLIIHLSEESKSPGMEVRFGGDAETSDRDGRATQNSHSCARGSGGSPGPFRHPETKELIALTKCQWGTS
jgi:hypothetical protein